MLPLKRIDHISMAAADWRQQSAKLERLLGFRPQGDRLLIDPCIPKHWPAFQIRYRHKSATYEITIENPLGVCGGVLAVKLDGETVSGDVKNLIPLVDDGATHRVLVVLG